MHAASVGEVMAAAPILMEYRERRPGDKIVLTVITPGGHEVAMTMVGKLVDHVFYAPFDFPAAVKRAVRVIQPDLFIGLETEIWPNLLHHVRQSGALLALVNGRLSDKSFPRYRWMRPLVGRVLSNFARILAQTVADAKRFKAIGAEPARVEVIGNAKFDQAEDRLTDGEREALRRDLRLPKNAPVLVVGSTRTADEERQVYAAYREVCRRVPDVVLIHAPRHVDRAEEIAGLMREAGMEPVRRSHMSVHEGLVRHLILDTFGELARVYAVADVAFIGNSLTPPGGGQNLLQPLAQGVPVVYGPHMQNFRDLCALAEKEQVGFRVADSQELAHRQTDLLMDHAGRTQIAERAVNLIQSNRGAAARYADVLADLMSQKLASESTHSSAPVRPCDPTNTCSQ